MTRCEVPKISATIFKIKRYAIHDGPGIRTTVFLKGCPLRCFWCHNPEGQAFEPQEIAGGPATGGKPQIAGWPATVAEIISEIEKDLVFFDDSGGGVTFSGGEPLAQPDFLISLLAACRQRNLHTVLDTSGFAEQETFMAAAKLADLVLFDLKAMDPELHHKVTGVDNRQILKNFNAACQAGIPMRVRVPLVPSVSTTAENLSHLADFLTSQPLIYPVDLLPYHDIGLDKYRRLGLGSRIRKIVKLSDQEINLAKQILSDSKLEVSIGG